jgi:hypothetical protein
MSLFDETSIFKIIFIKFIIHYNLKTPLLNLDTQIRFNQLYVTELKYATYINQKDRL